MAEVFPHEMRHDLLLVKREELKYFKKHGDEEYQNIILASY